MNDIIGSLNGIVWGALVPLLLGVGLLFTIVTGFIQIRYFKHMWKLLFSSNTARDGITSFQAFATSLAARVGTGNLAGVAVAMTKGGAWCIILDVGNGTCRYVYIIYRICTWAIF